MMRPYDGILIYQADRLESLQNLRFSVPITVRFWSARRRSRIACCQGAEPDRPAFRTCQSMAGASASSRVSSWPGQVCSSGSPSPVVWESPSARIRRWPGARPAGSSRARIPWELVRNSSAWVCACWWLVEAGLEGLQHGAVSPTVAVYGEAWLAGIPVLQNLPGYAVQGTFDWWDILFAASGCGAAFLIEGMGRQRSGPVIAGEPRE